MRGIVFIGGEGPPAARSRELAGRADIIAAADSGLIAAEEAGLYPQWIIGDMDSLGDLRRLEKYPPERVLRYPADKDYTDTELALRFLWDQGCDETWIVGGGGGRIDHLLAIRSLFERERSPDRWITGSEDIRRLRAGDTLRFGAEGEGGGPGSPAPPRGCRVSVFPLGDGPWKAKSRFLTWPLDGLSWDRGFFGVSNTAPEGHFSVYAEGGNFLVISPLLPER
ncbi:MAG: thiamine diphosphokinase [Spirochaetaceae bacterium]|jgi:thiamine pyrophosphokinase|nr:thiamine diphosphokinase [Spirochaetaceae bacterium]